MAAYDLPADYCHRCQEEHKSRGDEPRCIKTEMQECEQYGERYREEEQEPDRRPMFMYGLNRLAWKLYWRTVQLSFPGEYGSPTLTALPFVMERFYDLWLTEEDYESLMTRLLLIYSTMREHYMAKVSSAMKQRGGQ